MTPSSAATIATIGEILKENGYATSWFGKNHNTPGYQYSLSGPFDQWPSGMGFDYFYGFMGGETDQWTPWLFRDHTQIFPWIGNPGYNLTTDMADEAIRHIKGLNAAAPDQPFFVYYAPGGTHAPHQPTPEWIAKFKGKFDMGWNAMREQIFANQKRLGVIPANTELTPWPDGQPEYGGAKLAKWETLTADEKKLFARQAEVFAAYAAYTDHEIGRVIQAVEDMGKLDNTLIIYICGDNGTSAEGSTVGTPFDLAALEAIDIPVAEQLKYYDVWGSDKTQPHMAVAWAWAFDTPFKWTKQIASHFGGTRQGMAISWPGHIKDARRHPHAVPPRDRYRADDPRGHRHPGAGDGQRHRAKADRRREHGLHLRQGQRERPIDTHHAVFRNDRQPRHLPRWLDRHDDAARGALVDGRRPMPDVVNGYKWELYNIAEDYSETNDLAAKMPDKLRSMQELFLVEAAKYNVLPLDNDVLERALAPRPSATAGRTVFTYSGEVSGLPDGNAPNILGKSFSITAEVEIPQGGAEGMLNTLGGRFGGYGLYLVKGKPVFTYVQLTTERFRWEGPEALTPGKHTIVFDFKYDGPGFGKGGTGVLSVDGKKVATQDDAADHSVPHEFDESFDVGVDTRTGVDDNDYHVPFRFTGKLDKLTIKLVPPNAEEERLFQQKRQETKNKAQ